MEKKKKRRRHRGLGFLILVMGVLIVCGVYQYREYGNIKDVMLKLIGQDPVIYQHVSEEIGEMDGKFYYQQLSEDSVSGAFAGAFGTCRANSCAQP